MTDPIDFDQRRTEMFEQRLSRLASLKGGGGGGTFDDMEQRVSNLEKRFDRFEGKLDTLIAAAGDARAQLAEVKGQVSALPSALAFGELKGRVESMPTTAKMASLLAMAVAIVTLVTKWHEIIAFFKP
jgi:hypothetical protein